MKTYIGEVKSIFQSFIFEPIIAGLYGFATYFFVLLIVKMIQYYFGFSANLKMDINDLSLASIGFVLFFLIKLLQNLRKRSFDNG